MDRSRPITVCVVRGAGVGHHVRGHLVVWNRKRGGAGDHPAPPMQLVAPVIQEPAVGIVLTPLACDLGLTGDAIALLGGRAALGERERAEEHRHPAPHEGGHLDLRDVREVLGDLTHDVVAVFRCAIWRPLKMQTQSTLCPSSRNLRPSVRR